MGKKEKINKTITLTDSSYYEDLIWMSYRYCIGRHTIAAAMHAPDIAKYSYEHLSPERRKFNANDIRRCINDSMHFSLQYDISDYRHFIPEDAVSSIIKYIEVNDVSKVDNFSVDNYQVTDDNGSVSFDTLDDKNKCVTSFATYYCDLLPWIKLANLFDTTCHRNIVFEHDDVQMEKECMPYPYMSIADNKYEILWVPIESYLDNPYIDIYIPKELIIEIKDV